MRISPISQVPRSLSPRVRRRTFRRERKRLDQRLPLRRRKHRRRVQLTASLKFPQFLKIQSLQRTSIFMKRLHPPQKSIHQLLRDLRGTSLQPMHSLWPSQQPRNPHSTQLHRILKMTDAYRLRKFYLVEAIRSNLVDKRDKIIAQLHRLEYRV